MNDQTIQCESCNERTFPPLIANRFCSAQCLYESEKKSLELWTPRSVMDKIFSKIKRDQTMINSLHLLRLNGKGMLLFKTHDFEMLSLLLSNSQDWKQVILSGCESHPCERFLLWFVSSKGESSFCEMNDNFQ